MAIRPVAFGLRLRDKGRTVSVRHQSRSPRSTVVIDAQDGRETRRRHHASLLAALGDAAASWRNRLH